MAAVVPRDWPRGMSAVVAAEYTGLSETAVRTLKDFPQPTPLSPGRVVWLREHVDAWLDKKAGKSQVKGWD